MNGFKEFQELLKLNYPAEQMGFKVGASEINRTSARFKLANSFQGINLEGYAENTANAYSALFKIFLLYSAFEQFLKIYEVKFFEIEETFSDYNYIYTSSQIRMQDASGLFLKFLFNQLESKHHKDRLNSFYSGVSNNPAVVAAAIRHVFAHGKLTPNANKSKPTNIAFICSILDEFLNKIMNVEFERSINLFKNSISKAVI